MTFLLPVRQDLHSLPELKIILQPRKALREQLVLSTRDQHCRNCSVEEDEARVLRPFSARDRLLVDPGREGPSDFCNCAGQSVIKEKVLHKNVAAVQSDIPL
jgi:hypothetical protein